MESALLVLVTQFTSVNEHDMMSEAAQFIRQARIGDGNCCLDVSRGKAVANERS